MAQDRSGTAETVKQNPNHADAADGSAEHRQGNRAGEKSQPGAQKSPGARMMTRAADARV